MYPKPLCKKRRLFGLAMLVILALAMFPAHVFGQQPSSGEHAHLQSASFQEILGEYQITKTLLSPESDSTSFKDSIKMIIFAKHPSSDNHMILAVDTINGYVYKHEFLSQKKVDAIIQKFMNDSENNQIIKRKPIILSSGEFPVLLGKYTLIPSNPTKLKASYDSPNYNHIILKQKPSEPFMNNLPPSKESSLPIDNKSAAELPDETAVRTSTEVSQPTLSPVTLDSLYHLITGIVTHLPSGSELDEQLGSWLNQIVTLPEANKSLTLSALPTSQASWSYKQVYNHALMASIAHAIVSAQYPEFAFMQGWDGSNYLIQDGRGVRGTMAFQGNRIVAAFRNENKPMHSKDSKIVFEQATPDIQQIAEKEVFPYLLEDFEGQVRPSVNTGFWISDGMLYASDSWEDLLQNGARLWYEQYLVFNPLHTEMQNMYTLSEAQFELFQKISALKIANPEQQIILTPAEVQVIASANGSSDEGLAASKTLFQQIGILFP